MVVQLVSEQTAGPHLRVYDEIRTRLGLGFVPSVFKAMAAVGADVLIQNWTAFKQTLLEGQLPLQLKEMIGLEVSREHASGSSIQFHARRLTFLGVPDEIVAMLVATGDVESLPERTRAILRFVRACALDAAEVSSDDLEALGLSEDEALEVVDTVLMVAGLNRFSIEVGLVPELEGL